MAKKKTHGGKRSGAGRPSTPDGPTKTVAATVPESIADELDQWVENNKPDGWNRSKAITEAIRDWLAKNI